MPGKVSVDGHLWENGMTHVRRIVVAGLLALGVGSAQAQQADPHACGCPHMAGQQDNSLAVVTGENRAGRLGVLRSGVVVFRSSAQPDALIVLRRHSVTGPVAWRVDLVRDGAVEQVWLNRWGSERGVGFDDDTGVYGQAAVVNTILGGRAYASLDQLWGWSLGEIAGKSSEPALYPNGAISGWNTITHKGWYMHHGVHADLPRTTQVRLMSNRDKDPVEIELLYADLRFPSQAPLGWPMNEDLDALLLPKPWDATLAF